jgi:hypothetical protein
LSNDLKEKQDGRERRRIFMKHEIILTDEQLDYLFQITDSDQSSDHPLVRRAARNINRKIRTMGLEAQVAATLKIATEHKEAEQYSDKLLCELWDKLGARGKIDEHEAAVERIRELISKEDELLNVALLTRQPK